MELREQVMFIFSARNMRVSSQAAAVLEAVNQIDVNAFVSINWPANEVQIAQANVGATEKSHAIAHAGFAPVLRACSNTVREPRQTPPKIPFEGIDHDFSPCAEVPGDRTFVSIAGAARLNNLLPPEAFGPLAHLLREPFSTGPLPQE